MSDTSFIKGLRDRIAELEKENRELKEENENLVLINKSLVDRNGGMAYENRRLKNENEKLKEKYDGLWKIYNEDVNERIEENEKLNLQIAELMGQRDGKQMVIDRLEIENKKLIKRIKEHVPTQILADFRKFKK